MDYCIDYIVQKHTGVNTKAYSLFEMMEMSGYILMDSRIGGEPKIRYSGMLSLEQWEETYTVSLVEKYAPLQQEKNRLMHELRNKIG